MWRQEGVHTPPKYVQVTLRDLGQGVDTSMSPLVGETAGILDVDTSYSCPKLPPIQAVQHRNLLDYLTDYYPILFPSFRRLDGTLLAKFGLPLRLLGKAAFFVSPGSLPMGAGLHQMAGDAQSPASSSSSPFSSSSLPLQSPQTTSDVRSHGIHFLNTDWNDSISNDNAFALKWNVSVAGAKAQLGLFKVTYPKDGVVVYEFASNLTDNMESTSCDWKPQDLDDELYAIWLAATDDVASNWTISPPWKPIRRAKGQSMPWVMPFVIPVCSLLALYAICLTAYLFFRKRRDARELREAALKAVVGRSNHSAGLPNGSVAAGSDDTSDSARTVETFTFEIIKGSDGLKKPGAAWLCTNTTSESCDSTAETLVSEGSSFSAHERALADSSVRFVRTKSPSD